MGFRLLGGHELLKEATRKKWKQEELNHWAHAEHHKCLHPIMLQATQKVFCTPASTSLCSNFRTSNLAYTLFVLQYLLQVIFSLSIHTVCALVMSHECMHCKSPSIQKAQRYISEMLCRFSRLEYPRALALHSGTPNALHSPEARWIPWICQSFPGQWMLGRLEPSCPV